MSSLALQLTLEQANNARRLMLLSNFESIRLVHVRAAHMTVEGCPVKSVEERMLPTATANALPGTNRFRVLIGHTIHGRRGAEGNLPEVQLDASFEFIYSLPPDTNPTQQELQAFAETNAIMNCWPYWRELIQNTVARMNLPPLLVPLLRLAPPPAPEQKPPVGQQPAAEKKQAVK